MKGNSVIVFVDDEFYILQTFKAIFRREFKNCEFVFSQSGDEAIEKLSKIDSSEINKLIVFSDWLMPGMKGDDLLVKIHSMFPQSIGFLLSGMINKEPETEVFEKGNIRQVIVKPWDNDQLKALVKGILEEE